MRRRDYPHEIIETFCVGRGVDEMWHGHHIKSESQPTTAINTNGSTILAINGAMSSKLVIA